MTLGTIAETIKNALSGRADQVQVEPGPNTVI